MHGACSPHRRYRVIHERIGSIFEPAAFEIFHSFLGAALKATKTDPAHAHPHAQCHASAAARATATASPAAATAAAKAAAASAASAALSGGDFDFGVLGPEEGHDVAQTVRQPIPHVVIMFLPVWRVTKPHALFPLLGSRGRCERQRSSLSTRFFLLKPLALYWRCVPPQDALREQAGSSFAINLVGKVAAMFTLQAETAAVLVRMDDAEVGAVHSNG